MTPLEPLESIQPSLEATLASSDYSKSFTLVRRICKEPEFLVVHALDFIDDPDDENFARYAASERRLEGAWSAVAKQIDDGLCPDLKSILNIISDMLFAGELSKVDIEWKKDLGGNAVGKTHYDFETAACIIRMLEGQEQDPSVPALSHTIVGTLLHECVHAYIFVEAFEGQPCSRRGIDMFEYH